MVVFGHSKRDKISGKHAAFKKEVGNSYRPTIPRLQGSKESETNLNHQELHQIPKKIGGQLQLRHQFTCGFATVPVCCPLRWWRITTGSPSTKYLSGKASRSWRGAVLLEVPSPFTPMIIQVDNGKSMEIPMSQRKMSGKSSEQLRIYYDIL